MNFLVAPNALKGSLTAQHAAAIIQKSLRRKYAASSVIPLPVADGGNGTLTCLMNVLGGSVHETTVAGPVPSLTVTARYGITADGVAVIESAEAIGLHHITPSPETVAQSTSRGLGELLREAWKHSPREIWIGLGGSATNDAGAGMALALGAHMFDENGEPLKEGAVNLLRLHSVTALAFHPEHTPVTVLTDVGNILLGDHGATSTYARQKGAAEDQLPYLESALKNYADVLEASTGKLCRNIPGAGAAGGLGFGLTALCHATIVSGIDFVLDAVRFDERANECDQIITTEGMIDRQTLYGKGIAGICARAKKFRKPVHAFVGAVNGDPEQLKSELGLASLTCISPPDMPPAQAMQDAHWLLADAVYHHSLGVR